MIDLSLVPEDELWSEIQKRNCAGVMAVLKDYDGNREGVLVCYFGGKFTCVGLVHHLMGCMEYEIDSGDELEGEG